MRGGHTIRALPLILLAGLLAAGLFPPPVVAAPGSSQSYTLDYEAAATGSFDTALRRLALTTTLTITTPATGLSSLVLGVVPRGFSAWTTTSTTVDGAPAAPSWSRTIGMVFDLSSAPWTAGSQHVVVVSGSIDFIASTAPNARLRRLGSGTSLTLTAGDFLPLPVAAARWPVHADPGNAAVARSITVTITSPTTIPNNGVIMSGDQSTTVSGHTWTSTIAPARSFAFVLSPSFTTTNAAAFTLTGPDGNAQSVRVAAAGASSTLRSAYLLTGVASVKWLWSRFGAGPYDRYKIVGVPVAGAAHEFAGLVMLDAAMTPAYRQIELRHEIAHQWWYGLVATDQNADPWMDEGLAEWSARRMGGATTPYRLGNCTRAVDGPAYSVASYYPNKFGINSYFECVYLRGMNTFFALGSAMGGQTRLEACLKGYAQANRFGAPGPVVLAQAIRDCNERTLATLTKYLSAATVNATR